jgi:hypothetical protein
MIILLGKHQFTVSSVDDAPSTQNSFISAGSGKVSYLPDGVSVALGVFGVGSVLPN